MLFNGLCRGNNMTCSSEGIKRKERITEPKAPKSSYEIINDDKKKHQKISKIGFKPTKEVIFNENNIPKSMIDLTFYSILKKNGNQIIAMHIMNKCLNSKNPIFSETNVILYCHENEADLLRLVPFLIDLSLQMRCDIVSFDYSGFGCSSGKPEIYTIILDGEDIINFIIKELNSKIENIIIFGKGIGAMSAIYLASRRVNSNCKALILCMPLILKKIIDIGVMRSIFYPTLLIQEFEDKHQISGDEVINICREIPNEKEWLPIRKRNKENKKNLLFTDPNSENDDYEDVYSRHRCKFIIKIRDCIYPNQELLAKKKSKSSTGGSTDSDSNTFLNNINPETDHPMSMNKVIRNKNILNLNFDDCNNKIKNQNIINNKDNLNLKKDLFDRSEIEVNNDEDY
jgi:hypothetical protein